MEGGALGPAGWGASLVPSERGSEEGDGGLIDRVWSWCSAPAPTEPVYLEKGFGLIVTPAPLLGYSVRAEMRF